MIYETFFIGLIIAVLYTEITDIYPGGIIVPAYMALFLDNPLRIVATILVAFLGLYTYKLLSRFLILFGKRRFVMLVLLGAVWAQFWGILYPHFFTGPQELKAIGWVIPGLLANNLEKQRIFPTLASLFVASTITYFLVRIIFRFIS